jgi:arginase
MFRSILPLALILLLWIPSAASAQANRYLGDDGKVRVAVVKQPVKGSRNVPELSENPDYIEAGGLASRLEAMGVTLKPTATARLTAEEQGDYGEWHRLGLANGHLGDLVAANEREGYFTVGLLANCSSLSGVLAGLQHSGPTRRPLRVGLVFIDAHGDYNTPETTLSGMLGGMPVAVAAGHALTNVRLESGLNPALPTSYIVMSCVRDTDPLEQERIDRSDIEMIPVGDIRSLSQNIHDQMRRLSETTDIIYIHIDMDVLDPSEVPGHPLTVPDGPTSQELAAALTVMFQYEKTAALGLASTPAGDADPDGRSRQAAYNLIEGAIKGLQSR